MPYNSLPPPPLPPILIVAPFAVVQTTILEDTHARMDSIEQHIRQLRVSDSSSAWDDLDNIPMASLLAKFRMPDIERYTGVGCPHIHLRLYSIVMRGHGIDESQMITMFPLSLSDVLRGKLEGFRQRLDESISSFISRWQGKIVEIVDRPLQRGDSVLRVIRGLIRDPRRKFKPSWSEPYFIRELSLEGAAWLMDLDENQFSEPTNVDQLRKYYV
ncbi:hypothetical protein AAG906_035597 [Vitis piasezkii]